MLWGKIEHCTCSLGVIRNHYGRVASHFKFFGSGALSADGNALPLLSVSVTLTNRDASSLVECREFHPAPPCSLRLLLAERLSSSQSASSAAV